jgi:hypothetical protein
MKKINLFEEYANNTIASLNEATRSTMMMDGYKVTFILMEVTNSFGDLIVFLPKTSIDLDVIDGAYLNTDDAAQDILKHLNKQFKEISFKHVPESPAAGYSFKIDQMKLVNKIK